MSKTTIGWSVAFVLACAGHVGMSMPKTDEIFEDLASQNDALIKKELPSQLVKEGPRAAGSRGDPFSHHPIDGGTY